MIEDCCGPYAAVRQGPITPDEWQMLKERFDCLYVLNLTKCQTEASDEPTSPRV
jgi:hypothetical protein